MVTFYSLVLNCTKPAIDDFPPDIFTEEERYLGAIVLHIIFSLYIFLAIAVVCDEYFVPAMEKLCIVLNMTDDVAGASFMAMTTSAPELFVNIIGTFLTEGDIGFGTIVGSAVFNIFAVVGCCGLAAKTVITLNWWPLTRDCTCYGIAVSALIVIMSDEEVQWYEAIILVLLYCAYMVVIYFNESLQNCIRNFLQTRMNFTVTVSQSSMPHNIRSLASLGELEVGKRYRLLTFPWNESFLRKLAWIITWPLQFLFRFTIPNCKQSRNTKMYSLAVCMCAVWIGTLSYLVSWMITIIGDTYRIPDSIMGITFLAIGTSVPEAVTGFIVARKGHSEMGISNSIGSNTFDILLCLGLPWLIKSAFFPMQQDRHSVHIHSKGLEYSAVILLSILILLYFAFCWNNFMLDRNIGAACLVQYMVYLVIATLIEMNVFYPMNLPTCGKS